MVDDDMLVTHYNDQLRELKPELEENLTEFFSMM